MSDHAAGRVEGKSLPFLLKLSYGSGQGVDSVIQAAINTFLLFYLTAVCGMSGAAAGALFLISLVVDGLLDPFIGRLSDHWRSRWGRRLPFMVAGLSPIVVSAALLFSLPTGWNSAALFAYALTLNLVLRLSLSLFALPHTALTAELTSDYAERSLLSTFRSLFVVVGFALLLVPAFSLIFDGRSGLQIREHYPVLGLFTAGLVAMFGLVCLAGSGRALARLPKTSGLNEAPDGGFFSELLQLFRNPSFVPMFIGAVLVLVGGGAVQALGLHAFRFFWLIPTEMMQLPLLVVPLGMLIGTIAAAVLIKFVEKRDAVIGAVVALSAYPTCITLLALGGVIAPGTTLSTILVIFNGVVFGAGSAVCFVCFYSMIADAVDEHDHLFGVRREALYAAALMLGSKAATGLGAFVAGVGLQVVGFSVPAEGAPISLPMATSAGLAILWGPVSGVIILAALPFLFAYRINRARHVEILRGLTLRNAASMATTR
ncbi:MAG TPA: MFS transporter [Caulobacter sp.]|nr:MFS transporter [Caulobacter sp.]